MPSAQITHAAPARRSGQCVKRPIAPALIGWPCCLHSPREEPKWLIPHHSRSRSTADCRPLLQQSLPNRGRVVQPGKRAAFPSAAHLVRLTDRHSICTAAGALSGEPTAHTWNVRPQAPTPADSFSLLLECSRIHHLRALLGGLFLDTGCLLSVFEQTKPAPEVRPRSSQLLHGFVVVPLRCWSPALAGRGQR